jgi:sugar phosphate isomerase/epimerase
MHERDREPDDWTANRRTFLKGMAVTVGGIALTSRASDLFASSRSIPRTTARAGWADQIGLELFTVRDMTAKDYVGTLEKIAAIGYKEIEPAGGYGNMSPRDFRALLDRLGLRMPSTHSGVTFGSQPEMEKQLADFQIMGIEYTELSEPRPAGGRGAGRGRPPAAAPTNPAEQRQMQAQFIRGMVQPRTVADVKQEAARYNDAGKVAKKFGIKLLIHNHTAEFLPCKDSDQLPYSILLAETDPELVVFQLDIGWAVVAGQNPVQLFEQHSGRFPLWHVKDVACLSALPPVPDQGGRMAGARLVPVGTGDIDYGTIFKHAATAGLKHFAVEQDSAADWGDSIAAARVSFEHLKAMLTAPAQ